MEIIIVSALWCTSCLKMYPVFNKLKELYKDIKFVEYDYDFDEEVKNYEIGKIIPVILVKKDDLEVTRIIGEHKIEEIINKIEEVIK